MISGFNIASSDSEAAWRGVVDSPCVHVMLFFFPPGRLPLSSHASPFARCFVASVSEELHLVSVVLGNAPSTDFFCFLFLTFKHRMRDLKTLSPTVKGPATGEPKYITGYYYIFIYTNHLGHNEISVQRHIDNNMIQKSNSSDLLSFEPFPLKGALIIRQDFEALSGRQEVEYFFL